MLVNISYHNLKKKKYMLQVLDKAERFGLGSERKFYAIYETKM